MLEKHYQPEAIEKKFYSLWEENNCFTPEENSKKPSYTIVIPPPNVTGNLHMGHALNNSLQDILVRFHRMNGYNCLWLPGTDHAGIATQSLVERQLAADGQDRHQLGREKFIEKVWQWKEHSGGNILNQVRSIGASVDWSRERFTMDEGLSEAVLEVFVQLYNDGLIYKDTRLVNWDPVLETAISDLEVVSQETQGHLWHIRYPIKESDEFITIATTRPETIFGDSAIAVHPDDERYFHLHGKFAILPYDGRELPIIKDEMADPEQGSGAVKISPAHDFNDYECGRRHNLAMPIMMDKKGHLIAPAPAEFIGMERFAARKKLLAMLEQDNYLVKAEKHTHMVPHGDRSGKPIEPMLTEQWFADAKTLAQPAIEAVETGKTKFYPENWSKTYFDWLRNIQPWCISRQLWWGHQIPAWYGPDGHIFVARTSEQAEQQAEKHYGKPTALTRDPDVLDTWFSSALWAFSPLGWPDKDSHDLKHFFPTSLLVTGFDIIFFWVARMMMFSLYFMKDVPFRTVYVHALVRDAKGAKMSKSKGNVIDPMDLIEKHGCDAMRFGLAWLAAPGRDIKLSEDKIVSCRNFATKLWNATRFAQMQDAHYDPDNFDLNKVTHPVHRWVIHQMSTLSDNLQQQITGYRFHDAAGGLYQFIWGVFCDWYLEFSKNIDEAHKAENKQVTAWALENLLIMLHPFMPFITSELYQQGKFSKNSDKILMLQSWQKIDFVDEKSCAHIDWLMRLVTNIRSVRSELNLPPAQILPLSLSKLNAENLEFLQAHQAQLTRLARVNLTIDSADDASPQVQKDVQKGAIQILHDEALGMLLIADAIDMDAEIIRLHKNRDDLLQKQTGINTRLGNQEFLQKAPDNVVESAKAELANISENIAKLDNAIKLLQSSL